VTECCALPSVLSSDDAVMISVAAGAPRRWRSSSGLSKCTWEIQTLWNIRFARWDQEHD
jgi:hypothetical protein